MDLSAQTATAMVGDRPHHTALVTTGKDGWETPIGEFQIGYRVYDETMTSASIGAEEYYVLEHVMFTQYFTSEGHALHLNYWRPDSVFGHERTSHGCVGMRYADAEFFWSFAGNGTRVVIHERTGPGSAADWPARSGYAIVPMLVSIHNAYTRRRRAGSRSRCNFG